MLRKNIGARYIITTANYLTRRDEALVMDCSTKTIAKFIFEYILSRFGYPKILMSDEGTNFLNKTIEALTEEFQVYHQNITPYHPQVNGIVEGFNKCLENALTKVCTVNRDE